MTSATVMALISARSSTLLNPMSGGALQRPGVVLPDRDGDVARGPLLDRVHLPLEILEARDELLSAHREGIVDDAERPVRRNRLGHPSKRVGLQGPVQGDHPEVECEKKLVAELHRQVEIGQWAV